MKVLIVGVNGFVGSNLAERILATTDWHIFGMDINTHYLNNIIDHNRFHFCDGDIFINNEWIEYHVKKCDVVLPMVAIAQPKLYVTNPIYVFELDFEQNLKIIRWVAKYGRRLIFPSTSEVYGMSREPEFKEGDSLFVYGPTHKMRWIYASSKQLMDRLIYAYGRDRGLRYTLIRPFNWVGPRLDTLASAAKGNCRVLTQFVYNLINNEPLRLVGGGSQKRTFTDISDGLDALMKILTDEPASNHRIFNLGNPENHHSIKELAVMTRRMYALYKGVEESVLPPIIDATVDEYYGDNTGYQEVSDRIPSIKLAKDLLGWSPEIPLETSIMNSIKYFCDEYVTSPEEINLNF